MYTNSSENRLEVFVILWARDAGVSSADAGWAAEAGDALLPVERLIRRPSAASASQDDAGSTAPQAAMTQTGVTGPRCRRAVALHCKWQSCSFSLFKHFATHNKAYNR